MTSWSTMALRRQSRVSPSKMRTPTAVGGLLPAGKASTTTRITYNQSRRRFCPTEETNSKRTSIKYASYYSSFWRINDQLAAPFCRSVIERKSGQTLVIDHGGSTGHLRACPFLGTWRAVLYGEVLVWAPAGDDFECFWQIHNPNIIFQDRLRDLRTGVPDFGRGGDGDEASPAKV